MKKYPYLQIAHSLTAEQHDVNAGNWLLRTYTRKGKQSKVIDLDTNGLLVTVLGIRNKAVDYREEQERVYHQPDSAGYKSVLALIAEARRITGAPKFVKAAAGFEFLLYIHGIDKIVTYYASSLLGQRASIQMAKDNGGTYTLETRLVASPGDRKFYGFESTALPKLLFNPDGKEAATVIDFANPPPDAAPPKPPGPEPIPCTNGLGCNVETGCKARKLAEFLKQNGMTLADAEKALRR